MKLFNYQRLFPICLILIVSGIFLGGVIFLNFFKGIPVGELTRDLTVIGGLPAYTGFLSQVGIFFWAASATICLFCVTFLSGNVKHYRLRRFLFNSGLLTLLLGLDDAFLLHESILPNNFGVPENLVLASYAGFVLLCIFRFYPIILDTDYVLLVIALSFFTFSVILDLFYPFARGKYFLEDGTKFIGIVSWLAYFFRVGEYAVCLNSVQKNAAPDR